MEIAEEDVKGGKKGARESKESKEALSNGMDRYTELHLKRIGEAGYNDSSYRHLVRYQGNERIMSGSIESWPFA